MVAGEWTAYPPATRGSPAPLPVAAGEAAKRWEKEAGGSRRGGRGVPVPPVGSRPGRGGHTHIACEAGGMFGQPAPPRSLQSRYRQDLKGAGPEPRFPPALDPPRPRRSPRCGYPVLPPRPRPAAGMAPIAGAAGRAGAWENSPGVLGGGQEGGFTSPRGPANTQGGEWITLPNAVL